MTSFMEFMFYLLCLNEILSVWSLEANTYSEARRHPTLRNREWHLRMGLVSYHIPVHFDIVPLVVVLVSEQFS